MKILITLSAVAAGFTAILLASDYQATHSPGILLTGALEGSALIVGFVHLLQHAWD